MNQPTLSLDPNTDDKLKLIQIEYGAYNTVGLSKIGEVFMGDNDHGQLGLTRKTGAGEFPRK